MKKTCKSSLFALIVFAFFNPSNAFAYLDPGSGSMLLQLILGGFAGLVVVLNLYWQSFLNLFKRSKPEDPLPPNGKGQ